MAIEPYLFFNGRCEEAIEFYRKLGRGSAHAHALQGQPRSPTRRERWHPVRITKSCICAPGRRYQRHGIRRSF